MMLFIDWFKKEKVGKTKIDVLESKYATIRGMFSDPKVNKDLRGLIADMEENIDNFKKTNRYYDVLGQLYVAFLRYANTSNDLGVVLTPTHITELFADIANVNRNSIVFDNCTGTCGFLIAAMSKMIKDANGDKAIEKSIKRYQLIGIEDSDKMYCLAASNMAIHGDGKTNIHYESGLNPLIIEEVKRMQKDGKSLRPTIGMLNPPYKADKKNDVEELEFVKWNLEALVEGGTCVAIVPMQCAIASDKSKNKKTFELKKELLQHHTLEAVFSMPDELFYNSDKSVVTCIMVFTAHKPHPKDKETFFGYFKDDGFEKRKKLGRIDVHNKWGKIKEEWLWLYRNRKEVVGKSVMHHVEAKDEWCAGAYMETLYDTISKSQFTKTVRDYITFRIYSDMNSSDVIYAPLQGNVYDLNTDTWEWFSLNDKRLFIVKGSKTTSLSDLELSGDGDYPYITIQATNNGVKAFFNYYTENGGVFTIDSAVKGYCSWHEEDFSASDHVEKLIPQFRCNNYIALFLVK